MPTIRDLAICIRHWDWSETSQTVSLFTRTHGVVRGLAKGSKREKSPFSGGIELLTMGEVVAITRSTGAMATITAWDLIDAYPAARRSLRAFFVGSYLMDLVHRSLTDEDPHPAMFDRVVEALASLATDPDRALLLAQWAALTETGYRPEVRADVLTGEPLGGDAPLTFLPRLGGFAGNAGEAEGWRVRPETRAVLADLDQGGPPPGAGESVIRAARLLGSYVRHVLGEEPPSMHLVFSESELQR